jgi:predicted NUDIX family NTP pyrophosphohydrolase
MAKKSAGLIMYRRRKGAVEVLLVHPGGPFWSNKDLGAWSISKGELEGDEDPLETARREFEEETGVHPEGPFLELGTVRQKGGKEICGWAFEGDCDPRKISSNTFTVEWPPKSGRRQEFPEIDRAAFYPVAEAVNKINPAQIPFLNELVEKLGC